MFFTKSLDLPTIGEALPGRQQPITTSDVHVVNGRKLHGPYPDGLQVAEFAMGLLLGSRTRVLANAGRPCDGGRVLGRDHAQPQRMKKPARAAQDTPSRVLVVFDTAVVSYDALLKVFWEGHDPTQGMRQGNDRGTQYRSAIYTHSPEQAEAARSSKAAYEQALRARGLGPVTTEIKPAGPFYFAEPGHQQYLARNPGGYCGLGGTGVTCPIGVGVEAA